MPFDVTRVGAKVEADFTDFDQGMSKFEKSFAKLGQTLERTGQKMTTSVTLPIAALGAAIIKTASDIEESSSKFDAVFKGFAEGAEQDLQRVADATNRSVHDLKGYAAQLQDTFVPMGFAREEAAGLAVELTALAVDLASFNNVAESEVITRLSSAMVGNSEAVRSLGIDLSAAAIKQELLATGFKGSTQEATRQEKAMASLAIIMRSTTDAQGDAERTSESFANQLKGLQAAWKDLAVAVAQSGLLEFASKFVKSLSSFTSGLAKTNPELLRTITVIAALAAGMGPLLIITGKLITAIRALSALRFAALLNPWVLALAAVGGAIALVAKEIREQESTLERLAPDLDLVIGKTHAMTAADLSGALAKIESARATNEQHTAELRRYHNLLKQTPAFTREAERMSSAIRRNAEINFVLGLEMEKVHARAKELGVSIKELTSSFGSGGGGLSGAAAGAGKGVKKLGDDLEELKETARSIDTLIQRDLQLFLGVHTLDPRPVEQFANNITKSVSALGDFQLTIEDVGDTLSQGFGDADVSAGDFFDTLDLGLGVLEDFDRGLINTLSASGTLGSSLAMGLNLVNAFGGDLEAELKHIGDLLAQAFGFGGGLPSVGAQLASSTLEQVAELLAILRGAQAAGFGVQDETIRKTMDVLIQNIADGLKEIDKLAAAHAAIGLEFDAEAEKLAFLEDIFIELGLTLPLTSDLMLVLAHMIDQLRGEAEAASSSLVGFTGEFRRFTDEIVAGEAAFQGAKGAIAELAGEVAGLDEVVTAASKSFQGARRRIEEDAPDDDALPAPAGDPPAPPDPDLILIGDNFQLNLEALGTLSVELTPRQELFLVGIHETLEFIARGVGGGGGGLPGGGGGGLPGPGGERQVDIHVNLEGNTIGRITQRQQTRWAQYNFNTAL